MADANVPTAPTGPVDIKVLPTDYQTGPKDAKVTIVEYSDFQCPYCKQFSATIDQMLKDYKDKVLFVYRKLPLESIDRKPGRRRSPLTAAGNRASFSSSMTSCSPSRTRSATPPTPTSPNRSSWT